MSTLDHQHNHKTEQLTDAFRIFNQLSQNLTQSYQGLEAQVAKLHQELSAARTERINTLVEKEKIANRLQEIMAALPAAVVILNAHSQVLDCNAIAVEYLAEPLIGLPWEQVVERSLMSVSNSPHERQLKNGQRVSLTSSQLAGHSEQVILLSDVTEMHALQDMVNQQKHLSSMGEMVASMAHQVRTPLSTAILYASQMSNPALNEGKRQRYSKKILERLQHLERQVSDMLVFAKEGRLSMTAFSLTGLFERIKENMAEDLVGSAINFRLQSCLAEDEFQGNENALRGALMNILTNAVEALADSAGVIEMKVKQTGQNIDIVISDNGPGINNAQCERIFEPFYTTKSQGTGLGLAVVENVIRAHNGIIRCDSEPGKGTAFTLSLPNKNNKFSFLPGGFSGKSLIEQEVTHESV